MSSTIAKCERLGENGRTAGTLNMLVARLRGKNTYIRFIRLDNNVSILDCMTHDYDNGKYLKITLTLSLSFVVPETKMSIELFLSACTIAKLVTHVALRFNNRIDVLTPCGLSWHNSFSSFCNFDKIPFIFLKALSTTFIEQSR
jgi:hypothetical protein